MRLINVSTTFGLYIAVSLPKAVVFTTFGPYIVVSLPKAVMFTTFGHSSAVRRSIHLYIVNCCNLCNIIVVWGKISS